MIKKIGNDGIAGGRIGDGLGVELAQRCYFPDRTLEVGLAEKISRSGEYLTPDDFLVGEVVAVDYDVVQSGLLALGYSHLHVYRVSLDVRLDRSEVEEEITVVTIEL